MGSWFSKDRNVQYLLCVIDVFTKYAWVKLLEDKKGKTVLNAFIEIVNESKRKPNRLWVDKKNCVTDLFKNVLDNDDILMYSKHNEGKLVIAGRFIKTFKVKISKKLTANNNKSYLAYLNKSKDQSIQ